MVRRRNRIPAHQGVLTDAEIAEGIDVTLANCKRLLRDALMLYGQERYDSALVLATLATEESGKCAILREMLTAKAPTQRKALWNEWESHPGKSRQAIVQVLWHNITMIPDLSDFQRKFHEAASELADQMERAKQTAIYVHCTPGVKWQGPAVTQEEAIRAIAIGITCCKAANTSGAMTLLIETFLHPARGNTIQTRKACLELGEEMRARSLITEDECASLPSGFDDMVQYLKQALPVNHPVNK